MLGQTPLPVEEARLHLQVETHPAAWAQYVAARSTRFLYTGLGFAVIMLIGVSACALHPLGTHSSVEPPRLAAEAAFHPIPVLGPIRNDGVRARWHTPFTMLLPNHRAVAAAPRTPVGKRGQAPSLLLKPGWSASPSIRPAARMFMKDSERDDPLIFPRQFTGRTAAGSALGPSETESDEPTGPAPDEKQPDEEEHLDFAGMKSRQLKKLLEARGVSTEGVSPDVFEKEQLLELAEQFRYLLEGVEGPPAPTLQVVMDSSEWGAEKNFLSDSLRTQSMMVRGTDFWVQYDSDLPWQAPDALSVLPMPSGNANSMVSLMAVQGAITSMVLPYQPLGVVQAVNGAVAHRWQRIPPEERPLFLLSIKQLTQQRALGPDLVATALSVGSLPPMGKAAGLDRKAVEQAFGPDVATLVVELQQMGLIEETIEYTLGSCFVEDSIENGACVISEGQADLALSLFTGQKMQMSSRSLLLFLMLKASEYRLVSSLGIDSASDSMLLSIALANQVFAPLANLLGLGMVKDELEDAAFAISNPKERTKLRGLLGDARSEDLASGAARKIERALERKRIAEPSQFDGLASFRVYGRAKTAYSTWKKMNSKHLEFGQVLDKAALRIVLDVKGDEQGARLCFLVRDLVGELFPLEAGRSKDYVSHPKPNKYRSLHEVARWQDEYGVSAPFEIQIRTEEMHRQAEYGSSGHWGYKAGVTNTLAASRGAVDAGRDLFRRIDANSDGQITYVELQAALKDLGVEANLEQAKDMLRVFGTNNDGTLEFQQFYNALITTWFPLISGTHKPTKGVQLASPEVAKDVKTDLAD